MNNRIISCDWGTSSFRLYLIDTESLNFLASVRSHRGVANIHKAWQAQNQVDRVDFFKSYLKSQIEELQSHVTEDINHLPVFLSGMASSSIGMYELPYASLPLKLSGEGLIWKKIGANDLFQHPIYIISGLKTQNDVMRGEEVQIIGLTQHIPEETFIGIFPGTHSKHIWVKQGEVIDFQTYMTGELFQLISQHSILKNSIEKGDEDSHTEAFREGVLASQKNQLLHSLFSIRAKELIHRTSKSYNFYYLSGLLIGSEIHQLKHITQPIFMCGGSHLSNLYQKAFEVLEIKMTHISSELVENAVGLGHCKLILK